MKRLTTGEPSTLGAWRDIAASYFGEHSAPTQWLDNRIASSSRDELVEMDEGPMLHELGRLAAGKVHGRRFTDTLSGHQSEHDMMFVNEFTRVSSMLPFEPDHPTTQGATAQSDTALAETVARIMSYAHVRGVKLASLIIERMKT